MRRFHCHSISLSGMRNIKLGINRKEGKDMLREGMKVVCVDADGTSELIVNNIYTIRHIIPARMAMWRGVIDEHIAVLLHEVETDPGFDGFHSSRFRPAVSRKTDISLFKRMLLPKMQDA